MIKNEQRQEKQMLIMSMQKLIEHISDDPERKKDIFYSLSKADVLKILSNFTDSNQHLRICSTKLICLLLSKDERIKDMTFNLLQMSPIGGRVCLNCKFPQELSRDNQKLKQCLKLLKSPIQKVQYTKICWYIDIRNQPIQMQFIQNSSKIKNFPDPHHHLIGLIQSPDQLILNITSRSIQRKRSNSKPKSRSKNRPFKGYLNTEQPSNDSSADTLNSQSFLAIKYIKNPPIITKPQSANRELINKSTSSWNRIMTKKNNEQHNQNHVIISKMVISPGINSNQHNKFYNTKDYKDYDLLNINKIKYSPIKPQSSIINRDHSTHRSRQNQPVQLGTKKSEAQTSVPYTNYQTNLQKSKNIYTKHLFIAKN